MATIDLGDISVPPPPPPADPPSPSVIRAARLFAVVVLVLMGGAGASIGAEHLVNPLWTRPASLAGFVVGTRVVALSDPGSNAVIGVSPETGDIRWRINLPAPPQYLYSTGAGLIGVVVRDASAEDDDERITLLLTESGTILTRMPGSAVNLIPTKSLLLAESGQGSVTAGCPTDAEVCTDVAAFDVAGERQLWRRALPGLVAPSVAGPDGPLTRFAMVRANGLVELRDPATGDVTDAVRFDDSQGASVSDPRLLLAGDRLLSATRRGNMASLVAFPLTSGIPGWGEGVPMTGEGGLQFYVAGCGRYICLHVDGADWVRTPTGTAVTRTEYHVVGDVGPYLVAVPSPERSSTPQARRTVYLIRAEHPDEVTTLPDTAAVRWWSADGRILLARQDAEETTFTFIDPSGSTHLLGTVPGANLTCEASVAVLVCANPIGSIRTWPLRRLLAVR